MTKLLTQRQAANLLNVSEEYLVRLLDEKRIDSSNAGARRRHRLEDVLAFKDKRDRIDAPACAGSPS